MFELQYTWRKVFVLMRFIHKIHSYKIKMEMSISCPFLKENTQRCALLLKLPQVRKLYYFQFLIFWSVKTLPDIRQLFFWETFVIMFFSIFTLILKQRWLCFSRNKSHIFYKIQNETFIRVSAQLVKAAKGWTWVTFPYKCCWKYHGVWW